jgi:hypothetical protein
VRLTLMWNGWVAILVLARLLMVVHEENPHRPVNLIMKQRR